ncbi:iron complex outermembrane recepter protein [Chitinophaga sp. YR573]|uniref:TonB-dependent receptor n=1 Tax=Chitinophaga sp. YR573 TaxID=1881040 RepID=UPI0008C08B33|nr:TonB-dependent receptor [Chitinophaga sp. YR573]SEW01188.1 iron complex outermembrane recepter protein [Chitinophaga sp. YR573]
MTKRLLLLITLVFSITTVFAQNSVKGTVTTSDGNPAVNVTIRIENSKWGDITNEKGEYTIKYVKPGNWVLKVSAVAAASQEKAISIAEGQNLQVDFILKENSAQLQEVIVSQKNVKKETKSVARIPLKDLENPQVYSSVSAEILKQQVITSYDDAMRNVPGITRTWESTGRAGDGASYFALRGFDAQPTMYNGLPGITSGNLDPSNIEEIQVIKGPSGTLFGGSFYSYGGIINTITKKPHYNSTEGEIAYNFGSFGLNRVTADINTPLSKTEKIALRINTAYHSENSFQDAGFKKSFFIAPTLAYEVNDRLSFNVMVEILQEERAVPPVFFNSDRFSPLDFKTIKELNLNNNLSFTSNDLTIKNPRYNLQGQMLYKISDQWTSQTVISRGTVKSDGIYTYIWDDVSGDNYFSQYFHNEQQTINTTDIQQNFNGDFKIGKIRNRVLIGLDFFNRNVIDNGSGWGFGRSVTPQGDVNYVDPFSGDTLAPVYLTKASVNNLLAGTGVSNSNVTNSSYSIYASDVVNITRRLMAMVSLRADYFDSKGEKSASDDQFHQVALSPKFGLVYQPVLDKVSVFANYMNGFINVAPRQIADADGTNPRLKSFKPEHANQLEFGVKTNLFSDKLQATLSVYDIKVADRVVGVVGNVNDYTQGGKVRSKGFELDMNAHPLPNLNLIAGYSHNDIKNIEGVEGDFYTEPGRAPGGQGPQDLANLWATYKFTTGKIKNFGLGIGGNYAGKYKVIDNSATGVFYLPSYTLINGSVFYNSGKCRITFNVNNINNAVYYIGYWSVNPQKPRNFAASFAYKF